MNRADVLLRVQALGLEQQLELRRVLTKDEPERQRLVAAWVGRADQPQLEQHIRESLPPYMLPHGFLKLDSMPRNQNGKLDYSALAEHFVQPGYASMQVTTQPDAESDSSSWLMDIWCEVLELTSVQIDDNFFDLGGDSILGLKVVARARRAGYPLQASDMFEYPILREQALAVASTHQLARPQNNPMYDGKLTPIESWFFEQPLLRRDHWNMPIALALHKEVSLPALEVALQAVYAAIPELGTTFNEDGDGWHRVESENKPLCIDRIVTDELEASLLHAAELFQATLSLERGPLFRAVLIDANSEGRLLLLVAHHLIIDNISWHLLSDLIEQEYKDPSATSAASRVVTSNTAARWQSHLRQALEAGLFDDEVDYWSSMIAGSRPNDAQNLSGLNITRTLAVDSTSLLLGAANAPFNTTTEELLLCALSLAFEPEDHACIHMEHNGRGHHIDGADLSSAIGWFTALFPLRLPRFEAKDIVQHIQATKEARRAIPNDGIGYGALRYCHTDPKVRELLATPSPPVLFNYLGSLATQSDSGLFSHQMGTQELLNLARADSRSPYKLEMNLFVADGQLHIACTTGDEVEGSAFVARFEAQLERVLEACMAQSGTSYTPSDFPDAALNQDDLDSLLDELD